MTSTDKASLINSFLIIYDSFRMLLPFVSLKGTSQFTAKFTLMWQQSIGVFSLPLHAFDNNNNTSIYRLKCLLLWTLRWMETKAKKINQWNCNKIWWHSRRNNKFATSETRGMFWVSSHFCHRNARWGGGKMHCITTAVIIPPCLYCLWPNFRLKRKLEAPRWNAPKNIATHNNDEQIVVIGKI